MNLSAKVGVDINDKILQAERVKSDSKVVTYMDRLDALPQGTFVSLQKAPGQAFLLWYCALWGWSPEGYIEGPKVSPTTKVVVLTPVSTVNALKTGYQSVVALHKIVAESHSFPSARNLNAS